MKQTFPSIRKTSIISFLLLSGLTIGLLFVYQKKQNIPIKTVSDKDEKISKTPEKKQVIDIKTPELSSIHTEQSSKVLNISPVSQADLARAKYQQVLNNHRYFKHSEEDIAKIMRSKRIKNIPNHAEIIQGKSNDKYNKTDRPDLALEYDNMRTMDPILQRVPRERLSVAYQETMNRFQIEASIPNVNWSERGPNNVAGRTRAIMFDPNDVTKRKVWAGGVAGGLWYNNDITSNTSEWQKVDDFWANMAVTSIASDPSNPQIFYVGTGEGFFNVDAVRGGGIWKTTNGGTSWTQLVNTSSNDDFAYIQEIVVNASGAVFVATRGESSNNGGILRSIDGGSSWTRVLAPGSNIGVSISSYANRAADLDIASNGDIYACLGIFSQGRVFRSSDSGNSWTDITPSTNCYRIELAIAPSASNATNTTVLYAVARATSGSDNDVAWFRKSTNGGASWTDVTIPLYLNSNCSLSTAHFTRNQAWYDLSISIHPTNPNIVLVGGVDVHRTIDGGTSWSAVSYWTGACKPYVHADIHNIVFRPNFTNELLIASDGGVSYSNNAGDNGASSPNFSDRNLGYNITQFYACAIRNEASSNNFLAGSQDNGTQRYSQAGINATTEVTGGDGAFCFIDQNNGNRQITSYVYNNYYRSTNGGTSFSTLTSSNTGQFINPADLDDRDASTSILYSSSATNQYRYYDLINGSSQQIVSASIGGSVSAIKARTSTANRIFLGTFNGGVYMVENANTASPTVTNIGSGISTVGTVSSIDVSGVNDNNIIVTYSNYGVKSVWYTNNGGTSWISKDETGYGLPDMPVRWVLINPNNPQQVLLATELGVWSTDNITASNPGWQPSNQSLANVRCDMLKYRTADKLVAVATHARGLYTSDVFQDMPAPQALPATNITANSFTANWTTVTGAGISYRLDVATDNNFTNILSSYNSVTVNGTSLNITGLTQATIYYYRVRATNGTITSGNSNIIAVSTTIPAPVATAATNVDVGGFSANWNTVNGSNISYRLDVATDNSFTNVVASSFNVTANGLTFSVTGLNSNTDYYYRVRATNGLQTSPNSNIIQLKTTNLLAVVATPATDVTTTSFRANWNALNSSGFSYRVDVATDNNFTNIITGYNNRIVNGLSLNVTGLTTNTDYFYRVRATNGTITTPNSNIISVTVGVTAISDNLFGKNIEIYPNPSQDFCIIKVDDSQGNVFGIEVYDNVGKLLEKLDTKSQNQEIKMNIQNWKAGKYTIRLQQGDKKATKHFIKI
ncbi:MAG: fibronectin type III domain-containing protein [Raineya sp.]|jgi:hypothetical protein|nr:fibronectin type III domain-containing protein [Raineya sp.]